MKKVLRIGTRGSPLALWQANWVKEQLEGRHPELRVELTPIRTKGDKILDVPLAQVGGKGLFVKEIEEAILREEVDLAVHSMKDVPTQLPDGLIIGAITEREDIRDVLVSRDGLKLAALPREARIGTSSLRRGAQLKGLRKDFILVSLRGNLDTRLKKLYSQELSAVVVAAAGMHRMGFAGRITEYLAPEVCLPAIGQGALGLEWRKEDRMVQELAGFLNHPPTALAVRSERSFLKVLEGGCQVPIACWGEVREGRIRLRGMVADLEGERILKGTLEGKAEEGEALGARLAGDLLKQGAGDILKEIYQRE